MATTAPSQITAFRLVYRSHSLVPQPGRNAALAEIFKTARSHNKRAGITGALLITDHWFVQALEGEESAVRDLYARIADDPRHEQVTLIESGSVGVRVFPRWAMAEVSKSGGADIPLIADADHGGVTPAAAHGTTREQSAVLRVMRNSIGADTL
jgi:hypothetical protein